MLIMISLVLTGVITPEEGISGFSNPATMTVAFMFVLSAALLKTGALQSVAHQLSGVFRQNFRLGLVLMMFLIAVISAFVNNTPVVAVFIPVVVQIAYSSGQAPSKMLIPLSFASIMGGMCTLIGTSTNILVSGIAEQAGLPAFGMFQLSPLGVPLMIAGMIFMLLIGRKLLPDRKKENLSERFGLGDYLTELQLLEGNELSGTRIMDSALVKELEMDIIEVVRNDQRFTLPPGDFMLEAGDLLKVRCDVAKVKALKERVKIIADNTIKVGDNFLGEKNTSLVELVVTAGSSFSNQTLKSLDFRRTYRAIPLAIRHRNEVLHDHLYSVPLVSGDVILAEVKQHFISNLKQMEADQDAPFVVLSEDRLTDFNRRQFALVMSVVCFVIFTATFGLLPIMVATLTGVLALVLAGSLTMKEVYEAINWKIVFLLAGALSLGSAMGNTGLDQLIASGLIDYLGVYGPIAIVAGLYLTTSLLTEIMSNNATAALLAPIAIAAAGQLGISPMPLLVAVTIAASASFMTPIGYQTNTMVYSAGRYRFSDFFRVGVGLNLIFWVLASLLIPWLFPF
ncbi:MAG: SLC13 family permease [Phaeodactylibacter sp.]|nr:SLC13 family permease [Phaeodactylibacter sp.]